MPKGDPVKFGILFILMLISAVLEIAGIGMIPAFVSIVATPETVMQNEYAKPVLDVLEINGSKQLLIWGSVLLVSVYIFKSLYIIGFNYFEARFIFNRKYYVANNLMTSYMQAPYTFHLGRNSAELLRNITKEVNLLFIVIQDTMKMAREGVMALCILLFLFVMEPLITLVVILLSGVTGGGFILFTQKKVKKYGSQDQHHRNQMIKAINQGIGGIKDARLLNREQEFINQYGSEAYKSTRLEAFIRFVLQIPRPVIETTAVAGIMMIAVIMVYSGRPFEAIIPVLTLFAVATVRLMPAVQQISSLYTSLLYNIVAVDPIYEDMKNLKDETRALQEDRKSNKKLQIKDSLNANSIYYQYPESDEYALKGVSFNIEPGTSVAFVGESGAGKTTIVDLLLGLLKPTKGIISVDGINIQNSLSAWQKNLGYIPQTIYMADDTLRKNIAYGLPADQIDDKEIERAIEMAQLKDLISSLPKGLDTVIGEHGTRLSGGQRQRVGIARAIYHNPKVLVMDEATSSLDNVTEKQITNAIESLKGERTVIMIAHRLTTVENCDLLYLMKDGKIIDQGSYNKLIENNKEFRKMALVLDD